MVTGSLARQRGRLGVGKGKGHGLVSRRVCSVSHSHRTHCTSSTRSVRTGVPLISRMRSPGWMALRLLGLMCIRLTLGQTRVEMG